MSKKKVAAFLENSVSQLTIDTLWNISPLNKDFVLTSNSSISTLELNSATLSICNLKAPVILPVTYNVLANETSPCVNNSFDIVTFWDISRYVKLASLYNVKASFPTFINLDPSP